jgi:formate hydrogenlyase transcriptional activator
MDRLSASPCETLAERYQALLEVAQAIATHRDLHELFRDLAQRLPRVVHVNFVALSLHDPARHVMRLQTIQANVPADLIGGHQEPVEETPAGLVWQTQQPILVPDLEEEHRWPKVTQRMKEDGTKSFCIVPLTTAVRRLGAMGFSSLQKGAYGETDLEFLQQIGKQVAVAVESASNFENAQSAQRHLTRERDRLQLLLQVNNAVVSRLELRELFGAISTCLRKVIPHDYTSLALYEPERQGFLVYALDFPGGKGFIKEGMRAPLATPAGKAFRTGRPFLVAPDDLARCQSDFGQRIAAEGLRTACCLPLISGERTLGTLNVARLRDDPFTPDDVEWLEQVANQVAIAVDNALAHEELRILQDKLAKEKLYLEEEIQTEYNFEEIVGDGQALKRVLKQVRTVAATDSTVLILGETGSGKELVARALHNLSNRRERTFVKLNCAAIPTGLLESELFGHEKGAFTGAIATKIGRFELADRGTLFLDEVGEIPLELQVKLLRVLQEQEFERLGSTRTLRVNVRLVAATNRDLGQMVEEQKFRTDLYYRLKVFPITVPPLRERAEDIPLLVRHFAQKFAQRMKKHIETIPSEAMKALQNYPWPGNVRELENFVERAVILTQGADLFVPLAELTRPTKNPAGSPATLEQAERAHILKVLRDTNWVVGGTVGAAAKLGMKRTTLQSKMQKLGIERPPSP